MDVCFREDQSRARAGYAAENLATLRRLALNLLKHLTNSISSLNWRAYGLPTNLSKLIPRERWLTIEPHFR